MMKLAFGALLFGLVACGGGDKDPIILIDSSGPVTECNPVAQTGCSDNEKCSWIIDQAVPVQVGHIGCAPVDGNEQPEGSACLNAGDPGANPPGANGYDNCAKGSVCVRGLCEAICDPAAINGDPGTCDSVLSDNHHSCGQYIGVFEVAGSNLAGACDANCNVLDQQRFDGAPACGSPTASAPIRGCYANFNKFLKNADGTNGSCAPVRADDFVPTDPADQQLVDSVKHLDRVDHILPRFQKCKNCCAPGFVAEFREMDASMTFTCVGLCAPTPLNNQTIVNNPSREFGDDSVLAKLPRAAAGNVGDAQCTINKKGISSGPLLGTAENCVYSWPIYIKTDGTLDAIGIEGEQLGFCWSPSFYHYQNDDGESVVFPNFKNLPPRSGSTPNMFPGTTAAPPDDACDFAPTGVTTCTRQQAGFTGAFQSKPVPPQKRVLRIDIDARSTAN